MSGCNLSIIISAPRVDNSHIDISGMQGQADTVVIVLVSSVGRLYLPDRDQPSTIENIKPLIGYCLQNGLY